MKYVLFFLCLCNPILRAEIVPTIDQINYEWLLQEGAETGYTDHIVVFKKIFQKMKVKNFLEFGMGYSTKYFLDSCTKVISVEFISSGYGPLWYQRCIDLFRECPNWIPIVYFTGYANDTSWARYKYLGSESVHKAWAYQCATHKNYALIDDFYLTELNAFITNLAKTRPIDIAFIDSGLLLRGDLVQLCFNKSPIIIAHNIAPNRTALGNDAYGYSRVITPENYEEIFIPMGSGLTAWIKKEPAFTAVADELRSYASGF